MMRRLVRSTWLVILFALAFLSGCITSKPTVIVPSEPTGTIPKERVTKARVSMDSPAVYRGLHQMDAVIRYYRQQKYSVTWFDPAGNLALGDSMLTIVRNVRYFGLLPQYYHLQEIDTLLKSRDRLWMERVEALMTDAFFCLANDLHYGVSRRSLSLVDSNAVQLLIDIRQTSDLGEALESREPTYSQYKQLKSALRSILDSAESQVREKLLHGEIDGASQIFKTVQSLEVNLERWRRETDFIEEDRYLYINLPSFMLHLVEGGRNVFESKVIVGAPATPTPDITSKVECLVTYPYWNVPRKISVEEFLPILQLGDTSFITRNNFDILDRNGKVLQPDSVDWKKFNRNYFPVSLRQREGKENSLGLIKFIFDNPHAVFLHDTNAKGLFRNKVRAYSHGCVRMEKAVELGHYLLSGSVTRRSPVLDKYLVQEERRFINLPQPVSIFIRYFTCEVVDNTFYVYDDCYDIDKEVAGSLYRPR